MMRDAVAPGCCPSGQGSGSTWSHLGGCWSEAVKYNASSSITWVFCFPWILDRFFSTTCNNDDIDAIDSYILRIFWVDSARIQQQKLLADGGFAYVYSGLDADSGDRDFGVQLINTFKWFEECIPWCFWNQNKAELKTHCIYTGT